MAAKNTQKCVGVVIYDFPKAKDCLTAMNWVHDFVKLPKGYKLCAILIETDVQFPSAQETSLEGISPLHTWVQVEAALKDKCKKAGEQTKTTVEDFHKLAKGFKEDDVFGKMYKGPSFQKSLEVAIKDLQPGLDTLIVRKDDAHAASSSSSQIKLPVESLKFLPAGCSIVLVAKKDGDVLSKKKKKDGDDAHQTATGKEKGGAK